MPRARKLQINLNNTAYYHCVSRCVRRGFLCGKDGYTGKCYEHRRQWVEDRIHMLASVFCVDVGAYAVMSNHTHLVLRIHQQKAQSLTDQHVIQRWHKLFRGTLLTRYALEGKTLTKAQIDTVSDTVKVWRARLADISWFMRSLNEYIARLANNEDNCSGRFWEGRFKCQALLCESALAACLAYVDLNPIRANMAATPETSEHTSIQYRINAAKAGKKPKYLLEFTGSCPLHKSEGLPFTLRDYLQLVDETGRNMVKNKAGAIDQGLPAILIRLNIDAIQWNELTTIFESCFAQVAGNEKQMLHYQATQKLKRLRNRKTAKRLFG